MVPYGDEADECGKHGRRKLKARTKHPTKFKEKKERRKSNERKDNVFYSNF